MKTEFLNGKHAVTKATKTEIIYGVHPVTEAMKAGKRDFYEVFIAKGMNRFPEIVNSAAACGINVKILPQAELSSLAGTGTHQGICARVSPYPLSDDVSAFFSENEFSNFLLVLDGIVDPQNLGALARTALCAGINGIIIPKDRSATPLPSVSKSSAGAIEHLRVAMVTNISSSLKELKNHGLWITGLDTSSDKSIYEVDFRTPTAIVVGGEEKGIRPLVKKQCDHLVSIPQISGFNSLNASVAGAIAMYEIVRQRTKA